MCTHIKTHCYTIFFKGLEGKVLAVGWVSIVEV